MQSKCQGRPYHHTIKEYADLRHFCFFRRQGKDPDKRCWWQSCLYLRLVPPLLNRSILASLLAPKHPALGACQQCQQQNVSQLSHSSWTLLPLCDALHQQLSPSHSSELPLYLAPQKRSEVASRALCKHSTSKTHSCFWPRLYSKFRTRCVLSAKGRMTALQANVVQRYKRHYPLSPQQMAEARDR